MNRWDDDYSLFVLGAMSIKGLGAGKSPLKTYNVIFLSTPTGPARVNIKVKSDSPGLGAH